MTCLQLSPTENRFVSCATDKSLRLWDISTPTPTGVLHLPEKAVASFDPEGFVMAVMAGQDSLKLYDLRNVDKVGVM